MRFHQHIKGNRPDGTQNATQMQPYRKQPEERDQRMRLRKITERARKRKKSQQHTGATWYWQNTTKQDTDKKDRLKELRRRHKEKDKSQPRMRPEEMRPQQTQQKCDQKNETEKDRLKELEKTHGGLVAMT